MFVVVLFNTPYWNQGMAAGNLDFTLSCDLERCYWLRSVSFIFAKFDVLFKDVSDGLTICWVFYMLVLVYFVEEILEWIDIPDIRRLTALLFPWF